MLSPLQITELGQVAEQEHMRDAMMRQQARQVRRTSRWNGLRRRLSRSRS